jgi:hypothetical protein
VNRFDSLFEEEISTDYQAQVFARADVELQRLKNKAASESAPAFEPWRHLFQWLKQNQMTSGLALTGFSAILFYFFQRQQKRPLSDPYGFHANLLMSSELITAQNDWDDLENLDLIEELDFIEEWDET